MRARGRRSSARYHRHTFIRVFCAGNSTSRSISSRSTKGSSAAESSHSGIGEDVATSGHGPAGWVGASGDDETGPMYPRHARWGLEVDGHHTLLTSTSGSAKCSSSIGIPRLARTILVSRGLSWMALCTASSPWRLCSVHGTGYSAHSREITRPLAATPTAADTAANTARPSNPRIHHMHKDAMKPHL